MEKFTKDNIKESLSELKDIYRKQKNYRIRTRLQSLILDKEGKFKKRTELARYLSVDYATLKRWTKEYQESGLTSFLSIKSGGNRHTIITPEIRQLISEKLHDSKNPLLGYFDAVNWLEKEHKESVKYHTLRAYMIRHFKAKLKHPGKLYYKKDEQAIEAFKKTTGSTNRH